jgi:hypothetical protein
MIRYLVRRWADPQLRADNDRLTADLLAAHSKLSATRHAHAKTMRALADEQIAHHATTRSAARITESLKDIHRKRVDQLEADLGASRDRERQLKRELAAEKVKVEDLRARERQWLGHYDVCERAQAVADHDRDQAASNA